MPTLTRAPGTVISAVSVFPTTTACVVTWNVVPASRGQVQYGLTTAYGLVSSLETNQLTFHAQELDFLLPGTVYHYRVTDGAGNVGPDMTFTTQGYPFDVGQTYIEDIAWPTGIGWTAGAVATIDANVNGLVASHGSGIDLTHTRRHIAAGGAVYPVEYINMHAADFITIEGGGVEQGASPGGSLNPFGHAGGAMITTNSDGSATGDTSTKAVFSAGQGGSVARFRGWRWHGLTLKGTGTQLASASAGSVGGYQYLISSFGGDDCVVDHCILTDAAGDLIELQQSSGTNGVASHQSTNWLIQYNQLLQSNRQGIGSQAGKGITLRSNYLADPAYAYLDLEPDSGYQRLQDWTIDGNIFGGHWNWTSVGGPSGVGFAVPAIFLTIPDSSGGHLDGFLRIINNVLAGIHAQANYPTNKHFIDTGFNPFTLHGEVTVTGNQKTSAPQVGPAAVINGVVNGPFTVGGNNGFLTSGPWLSAAGGVAATLIPANT